MSRALFCILALALASPASGKEKPAPTPQQELERLLREGNARARDSLEAGVEFLAFAHVKHRDGKVRVVNAPAMKGASHTPHRGFQRVPSQALDELAAAGGYRAVAIFTADEVRIEGKKTSAIQAGLEHESGYCVNVFTPYTRLREAEVLFGKRVSSQRPEGLVLEGCK